MTFEHALGQAVAVWQRRGLTDKTIEVYCYNLRRLNRQLNLMAPGADTRLDTWQESQMGETPAKINGDIVAMRSFYHALQGPNPARALPFARRPVRPPRPLSVQDTQRLFAQPMTLRDRVLLECMYPHGMRLMEARTLGTDQLTLVDGRLQVVVNGKGRRHRTLLLQPGTSRRMLQLVGRLDPLRPVFGLSERDAERVFRRIADGAGLSAVTHQLRHTTLTRMAEAQVPLLDIMAVSGHSNPQQVMQYVKLAGAARAVDAIAGVEP